MAGFDVDKFRKNLIYERTGTTEEVLNDIAVIRQQDRIAEETRKKWGWIGGLGILAAGALFLIGVNVEIMAMLGVSVAVGLFAIGSLIYRSSLGAMDTEDRRYELVGRILPLLGTDIPSDAPLNVRIDLTTVDAGRKAKGEGKANGWKVKYFEDPWLDLKGQMADGTKFALQVTEKFQKRSKWKRSSSGKMKHKSKTKSATEMALALKVKPKRYPALEKVHEQAQGALQLPNVVNVKRMVTAPDALTVRVGLKSEWDCTRLGEPERGLDGSKLVLSLFMSLYQVLNLSTAITKGREKVV